MSGVTVKSANEQYQQTLLKGVARSFALTIPQLPSSLRSIVGNAYLLCRIADTIEDDANIALSEKRELAQTFIGLLQLEKGVDKAADQFAKRFIDQLSSQRLPAEKQLIQDTAQVLSITRSFSGEQQDALQRCVGIMARGMVYYQAHSNRDGLQDIETFNNYCYHVAGVVGELLTELFALYSPAFDRQQLMPLAVSFGQGLQMTNILKDIWEDYQRGICWLPRDVFQSAGFDLNQLPANHQAAEFAAGLQKMIAIAHRHLHNAQAFVLTIPAHETGIRKFCIWAIGMALLTLRRIEQNPGFVAAEQIKISKSSVIKVMALTKITYRSNTLLKKAFNYWASTLPLAEVAETDITHEAIAEWFK